MKHAYAKKHIQRKKTKVEQASALTRERERESMQSKNQQRLQHSLCCQRTEKQKATTEKERHNFEG